MPARLLLTKAQRDALLALPETEEAFVRHYSLSGDDVEIIGRYRTPETRLAFALQLCVLRYPGRVLRQGDVMPFHLLGFIADQVGVSADAIAGFDRRQQTRSEHVVALRSRFGFSDLTTAAKAELKQWLAPIALKTTDGHAVLGALTEEMRQRHIIIPGISVIERMAAEVMYAAEKTAVRLICERVSSAQRTSMDAILAEKAHRQQSELSWLLKTKTKISRRGFLEIVDKLDKVREIGLGTLDLPPEIGARVQQMVREGLRFTTQAFQQMGVAQRTAIMTATLRDIEASLVDAALNLFEGLIGRAYNKAKKRVAEALLGQADETKQRLARVADVLDAILNAHDCSENIEAAIAGVTTWDTLSADAKLIRGSSRSVKVDVLSELGREHYVFKATGPRLLAAISFLGRASAAPLLDALAIIKGLDGDTRKPLPDKVPETIIEPSWRPHVFKNGGIDRQYYELAVYFALATALRAGDVWVTESKLHRSIESYLSPRADTALVPARLPATPVLTAARYLDDRMALLECRLVDVGKKLAAGQCTGARLDRERLSLPKPETKDDPEAHVLARRLYGLMPRVRITDLLEEVDRWTNFAEMFGHVQTGRAYPERRAFLAALIAEATNIGLGRMSEVCNAASRRTLTTISIWHMREETYRAALARIVEALHREPAAVWFGTGQVSSSDGQHFYLDGEGEGGGEVNAHYGRDPIIKLYTHISDRYAPFHVKVITGTSGEAVHVLDGLVNHDSAIDILAHHTDGGGISDHVFAVMYLLGIKFQPRMSSPNDRRLYAFEAKSRYGVLAPFMGERLDRNLIEANWDDVQHVISAFRNRVVVPSLILRKLGTTPRQSALSLAMREVGRIERTLHALNWIEDLGLRADTTDVLNKGEARHTLARAVAFHRLGRFRDRSHERQSHRAAALNLVTACIGVFNCRYLGRAVADLHRQGIAVDEQRLRRLSPLGWDHINLTGDYVWTESAAYDADGLRPLNGQFEQLAA
jgi:TnpA family transposase